MLPPLFPLLFFFSSSFPPPLHGAAFKNLRGETHVVEKETFHPSVPSSLFPPLFFFFFPSEELGRGGWREGPIGVPSFSPSPLPLLTARKIKRSHGLRFFLFPSFSSPFSPSYPPVHGAGSGRGEEREALCVIDFCSSFPSPFFSFFFFPPSWITLGHAVFRVRLDRGRGRGRLLVFESVPVSFSLPLFFPSSFLTTFDRAPEKKDSRLFAARSLFLFFPPSLELFASR